MGHDPLKKRGEADDGNDQEEEEEEEEEENDQEEKQAGDKRKKSAGTQSGANKKRETRQSKAPKKGPKPGETVSWNWGNGNPEGKVLDVKADKTSITTKRGNGVTRDGDPEDPAVVLDTGKSKAIKSNHELN